MNHLLKSVALMSLISAPNVLAGTHLVTGGLGQTDYELTQNSETFTSADWLDFEGAYTYVDDDSGFFFNAKYRTAMSATHNTFSGLESDLSNSRVSLSVGTGMIYVGYLKYNTTLSAPTGSFNGDVDYELGGFTFGLADSFPIGSGGHAIRWGLGMLMAEAELDQINSDGSSFTPEYDYTLGYFAGAGIGGPIGSTGLAYGVQYEYQFIEFDSIDSNPVLEDTRSRLSASITYVF